MRTIRNYLGFILALMLMIGCGSRSVKTAKTTEETHKKEETKTQVESVEKTQVESQKEVAVTEVQEIAQETQKQAIENEVRQRAKVKKKTTYYPNGQVKSQTESTETENETIAKQRLEIEYLQLSAEILKEERDALKKENNTLIQEKNTRSNEVKELKKEKDKNTNREAYPWYWWVIGGIVAWEFLKLLWRNYFKYLMKIR